MVEGEDRAHVQDLAETIAPRCAWRANGPIAPIEGRWPIDRSCRGGERSPGMTLPCSFAVKLHGFEGRDAVDSGGRQLEAQRQSGRKRTVARGAPREIPRDGTVACAVCVPYPYLAQARPMLRGFGRHVGRPGLQPLRPGRVYRGGVRGDAARSSAAAMRSSATRSAARSSARPMRWWRRSSSRRGTRDSRRSSASARRCEERERGAMRGGAGKAAGCGARGAARRSWKAR